MAREQARVKFTLHDGYKKTATLLTRARKKGGGGDTPSLGHPAGEERGRSTFGAHSPACRMRDGPGLHALPPAPDLMPPVAGSVHIFELSRLIGATRVISAKDPSGHGPHSQVPCRRTSRHQTPISTFPVHLLPPSSPTPLPSLLPLGQHPCQICFQMKVMGDVLEIHNIRAKLHQTVYQHHTANVAELMITDVLKRACDFTFRGANGQPTTLADAALDPSSFCQLTDAILEPIWLSLDANTAPARQLYARILRRDVYRQIGPPYTISHLPLCRNPKCRKPTPVHARFCSCCGVSCKGREHTGGREEDGMTDAARPGIPPLLRKTGEDFKEEILSLVSPEHRAQVKQHADEVAVHLVIITHGKVSASLGAAPPEPNTAREQGSHAGRALPESSRGPAPAPCPLACCGGALPRAVAPPHAGALPHNATCPTLCLAALRPFARPCLTVPLLPPGAGALKNGRVWQMVESARPALGCGVL